MELKAIVQVGKNVQDLFCQGKLASPMALVQTDWDNCFGKFERPYIRRCIREELPKHEASISWKHMHSSYVNHHVGKNQMDSFEKNRGSRARGCRGSLRGGALL